jgi:hypothetical protein
MALPHACGSSEVISTSADASVSAQTIAETIIRSYETTVFAKGMCVTPLVPGLFEPSFCRSGLAMVTRSVLPKSSESAHPTHHEKARLAADSTISCPVETQEHTDERTVHVINRCTCVFLILKLDEAKALARA